MDMKEGNVGCISTMLHVTAPSQPQEKRLVHLRHGLGVQVEGRRLNEGAHAGFKLGSPGEVHYRKNVTPLVQ